MLIIENFLLALSGLRANKMRALLTMLGIIIGISSVIAIVSIGDSVSKNMEKEMKDSGMTNLSANLSYIGEDGGSDGWGEPTADDLLSIDQIRSFEKAFTGRIKATSIEQSVGSADARVGRTQESVDITGTNQGYALIKKIKVQKGRYISASDLDRYSDVAVIPSSLDEKLSRGVMGGILGKEIKFVFDDKILTYTVVGIYDNSQKSGTSFGGYGDSNTVYIPATTAARQSNAKGFNFFEIMPAAKEDGEKLTNDIMAYFGKIYETNKNWSVDVYNAQKDANDFMATINKIKIAIAIIAGIALLVGGIGVMNIMLVSVTERTREIGVRKALGAKRQHIKIQFIIEAIIICAIGGIIGVILGLSISTSVSVYMKSPVVISIPTVLVSVLFSMGIGVFFGYYPANKAAKMDPIEALRYE